MRRILLIAVVLIAAPALVGCVVPEDMPALREELGYASVDPPDLVTRARASTLTPIVDQPVTLTAEVDGLPLDAVTVTWNVDDTIHEGASVEVSFPSPGTHPVHVEATGPNGTTATDDLQVDVRPNTPPEPAIVIENRDQLVADQPVVVRGGSSTDADADELTYEWRIDGDPVDAGERLTANLSAGPHEVELTVSDGHVSRAVREAFAVDQPIRHEAQLSTMEDSAQFTVPVVEGADVLRVALNHSTRGSLDDVNLTLRGPNGTPVAQSATSPEPGANQGTERIEVEGDELAAAPHTLDVRLERGTDVTVTIEGVLTYTPLPSDPR